MSLIKTGIPMAIGTKNITSKFNSHFIKAVCVFNVLQKLLWDSIYNFDMKENFINFIFYFLCLSIEKIIKIVSVKYDMAHLFHVAMLTNNGTRKIKFCATKNPTVSDGTLYFIKSRKPYLSHRSLYQISSLTQ